jgi:L-asparaginase II
MSEILVEVTRGEVVECIHRGDIAVCDINCNLHASAGSPDKTSYLRSAAKPIQALPVFTSGAFDRYRFNHAEIAVICSSHYAEEIHLQAISSILYKIGLAAENILGGIVTSLNPKFALELAWKNVELTPLFSDCSGKHAGMLSVCMHKGFDIANYLSPDHPCQQEILKTLAEMCSVLESEISIGIDGCNAPVHAMPLKNIAQGFARLANWQDAPPAYRQGADTIFHAMNTHPEMVSGTGGFCTELMRRTNGKLIGKIGAEGVYCIGVKDRNLGIAIKIESGNMAMLPPVAVGALEQLDLLDKNELESLKNYRVMDNTNDLGIAVGYIRPRFTLRLY